MIAWLSQGTPAQIAGTMILCGCVVYVVGLLATRGLAGTKVLFDLRSGGDRAIPLGRDRSEAPLPSADDRRVLAVIAGFDVRHEGRR
jgi:hypothetical protein